MLVSQAAFNTLAAWKKATPHFFPNTALRHTDGLSLAHLRWMLELLEKPPEGWDNAKLNRWLGYAQGALVWRGVLTLEQVKRANKEA